MAYIGRKPTSAALTSSDVADAIITSAKIASGDFIFNESGADADLRVESDGNTSMLHVNAGDDRVGIGTASPGGDFEVKMASNVRLVVDDTLASGVTVRSIQDSGNHNHMSVAADNIRFLTQTGSNTAEERMRILSGGGVVITKTSETVDDVGHEFRPTGLAVHTRNQDPPMLLNREGNDGDIVEFEGDGNKEGTISVSGSTISYNAFTGSHWSRLSDNSKPTILRGTVMESLDTMINWYNLHFTDSDGKKQELPHVLTGSQSAGDKITYDHNGTDYEATIVKEDDVKHMESKVSTTSEAKNVYGVFSAWDEDGEGYNDFYVASVGTYVIRVHKDETVAKGDLLQSNGDGTAKKLAGSTSITADVLSTVFAKVLSNTKIETYSDGSYIVPCSLMC